MCHSLASLDDVNSKEFDKNCMTPLISLMEDQSLETMGGTQRLGNYTCQLIPGTKAAALYGQETIQERHRHRYEFNNVYRETLEKAGLVVSGINPRRNLVEIVELPNHPYFVACQFHPEFKSRPTRSHPLFQGFINAAHAKKYGE